MENIENKENKEINKKKIYYKKFIEDNNELIHQSQKCQICGGSYTYFNKSRHIKSSKHMNFLPLYEELQNIDDEKDRIIFKLKNNFKF